MSTELTPVANRSTAVARPADVSPYREAVNDEIGASFGTFLKFQKGAWILGEDDKPVPSGTRFVANLEEYYRGWVRWWDGKPTDHLIGRVVDRYRPHAREELGDLDQQQWEVERNGAARDPWAKVVYLALRQIDGDENEVICFTSTSDGGRRAVAKLADRYDRLRHKHKAMMPVVVLESESYKHDEYGLIHKPFFKVVGWQYWDDEAAFEPEVAAETQRTRELDDDIPF